MTDITGFNQRVNMYLDKQLDREQERLMFSDVVGNPDYLEAFSKEQTKRNMLKCYTHRGHVDSDIIQTIKSKISL